MGCFLGDSPDTEYQLVLPRQAECNDHSNDSKTRGSLDTNKARIETFSATHCWGTVSKSYCPFGLHFVMESESYLLIHLQ